MTTITTTKTVEPVLNLTQHAATAEQVSSGVVEPDEKTLLSYDDEGNISGTVSYGKETVRNFLTFNQIPTQDQMDWLAGILVKIAVDSGCKKAMIGGAPFFMSTLERALLTAGIQPVYAFSVRESVERTDKEGNVIKTNVFKHVGFVEINK